MSKSGDIQDKFADGFARAWRDAKAHLTKCGFHYGAIVRNKDGRYFRITFIEPKIYNFGEPKAGFSCYGVMYRANETEDDEIRAGLGPIADGYRDRLSEVLTIILAKAG